MPETLDVKLEGYKPLPSQYKLHKSPARFKSYIGGFGSGKTAWLCYEVLMLLLENPNNYGVICRKTYPELEDTTKKEFMDIIPKGVIKNISKTHNRVEFVNGSIVLFRAFNELDKLTNLNFGFWAIDQAEELTEPEFLMLVGRLRAPHIKNRHGLMASNIKGKNWIYRYFVEKKFTDKLVALLEALGMKPEEMFDYVVATSDENTNLPDDYIQTMRALYPEEWQRRFLDAQFDDFEGSVIKEWKDEYKIMQEIMPNLYDIEDFGCFRYMIGIDTGIANPTAVVFACIDMREYLANKEEGLARIHIFDSIYEEGLQPADIAHLINAKMRRYNLDKKYLYRIVIDPSSFRREQTSGTSVGAEIQRLIGKTISRGNNDVPFGLGRINTILKNGNMFVSDELDDFFEELEEYKYAEYISIDKMREKNISEKPKKYKDHLMDAWRYICAEIPPTWIFRELRKKDADVSDILKRRLNGDFKPRDIRTESRHNATPERIQKMLDQKNSLTSRRKRIKLR
jgi:PBSX family phage terminase large subunit